MPAINVTEAEFEELILKEGIVLVDFWAAWCTSCTGIRRFNFSSFSARHG